MFIFVAIPLDWGRKWQPTPVFLLRKSEGQREPGSLQSSSAQFSRSVVSDSLRPHEPQHARPPCPSPTPGVHPNYRPLSRWCHPTISSSVVPFSSSPQSFPASGSFQMSQLFASGGQNIGVSASSSVLPMNIQDWFLLGWSVWISLQSKGLSRVIMSKIIKEKCISSLHQFGGNGHLNSNEPSNPWVWYISFLTDIFFNFTQQCFSVFSILHFFKK